MIAEQTPVLATPEETLKFFGQVDAVLGILGARIARILLNGPLNSAQHVHYRSALELVDGLRAQFNAERARQAASLIRRLES